MKNEIQLVTADWKDFGGFIDELKIACNKLEIHITDDPQFAGGGDFAVIMSKSKITKSKYKKYLKNNFAEEIEGREILAKQLIEN